MKSYKQFTSESVNITRLTVGDDVIVKRGMYAKQTGVVAEIDLDQNEVEVKLDKSGERVGFNPNEIRNI